MTIATEAFIRFVDLRNFNCYARLFYSLISSINSQHLKTIVSHRADKITKNDLHLIAVTVIRRVGDEMRCITNEKLSKERI